MSIARTILSLILTLQLYICSGKPVNTDSIFNASIIDSRNENYIEAIRKAKLVLDIDSTRDDVSIFIANNYAWQQKYDSAKVAIQNANRLNPNSTELYDSWLNILLWHNEYTTLLAICDTAQLHNYNSYKLLLKRAYALKGLERFEEVIALIEEEENSTFADSIPIKNIYRDAQIKRRTNLITFYYSVDEFNDLFSHIASIDYLFNINNDKLISRLSYANRFDKSGIQIEADYYKKLQHEHYLYFNYGLSVASSLFPEQRAGIEYYSPLVKHWDGSLGARYLRFSSSNVFIATGHLSTYFKSNWLALRPFYVIQKLGKSVSIISTYRRYTKTTFSYWGLELGYGNSPEERYSITQGSSFLRLDSYKAKVERNILIGKIDELKIGISYAREELISQKFSNRYSLELIYKLKY